MNRIFIAAIAIALVGLSIPAGATTFPSLTRIYFASGAVDNSTDPAIGISTVVSCSNMSGQTASVRYQFRDFVGAPIAGGTLLITSLRTQIITSEGNVTFLAETALLPTGVFFGGSLEILSTQSAIYCSAWLVRADGDFTGPSGVALHLVRFNPHPGTVE